MQIQTSISEVEGKFDQSTLNYYYRFSAALKSFTNAHQEMRGKSFIDYRPLGLQHILHEWQVGSNTVFN